MADRSNPELGPSAPIAIESAQKALAAAEQGLDLAVRRGSPSEVRHLVHIIGSEQPGGLSPRTLRDLCAKMRDRVAQLLGDAPPSSPPEASRANC